MREEKIVHRETVEEDTKGEKGREKERDIIETPSFIPREDKDSARRSDDAIDDLIVLLATKADRS